MDEITKLDAILAIFTTPSEGEEMTVSTNVKQETMAALRSSHSQTEAAGKLGITQGALSYRIKNDPDLMELAVSKGFVRGKAAGERPAVAEAAKILGAAETPTARPMASDAPEPTSKPAPEATSRDELPAPETLPVLAFKGLVVFLGESFWVDVRVERRAG